MVELSDKSYGSLMDTSAVAASLGLRFHVIFVAKPGVLDKVTFKGRTLIRENTVVVKAKPQPQMKSVNIDGLHILLFNHMFSK